MTSDDAPQVSFDTRHTASCFQYPIEVAAEVNARAITANQDEEATLEES